MTENTKVLAAVLQMNSTEDVAANVASALALVEEAVLWGAELLVLPEKFHYLGGAKGAVAASEPLDGALMTSLSETCLLYTSDAADDLTRVDLRGRRMLNKKKDEQIEDVQ